tara:strand:+ start:456 stop:626 length:171 start_codon:yes stop_codon:yes gene_type:complete
MTTVKAINRNVLAVAAIDSGWFKDDGSMVLVILDAVKVIGKAEGNEGVLIPLVHTQ